MLLRNTMWQRGCERSQRFFRELSKNVTFIRTICHRKTLFLDPPKYLRKWDMDGHGLKNQVLVPMDPGGTKGSTPGRWDLPKPREKFPGPGSSTKEVTPQLQDTRACLNAPTRDTCRRPPLTCRSSALSQFPWKKAGQPFNPPSLGLYLGRPPPKRDFSWLRLRIVFSQQGQLVTQAMKALHKLWMSQLTLQVGCHLRR